MKRMNVVACGLVAALAYQSASGQQPAAQSTEQQAIEDSARAFVTAFDEANAKAIANLWTEDGEYIVGEATTQGRPAIEKLYEQFFRDHPGARIEVRIDSVRVLAPAIAIEHGTASVFGRGGAADSSAAYTAVHVKQNGRWQMASVRESALPNSTSGLQQLAWLVGDWAASGDAAKVDLKFDWIANNNFLRGETTIRASADAGTVPGGVQIIGRDPLTGQIVSWYFNADGGHGFGIWSKDGDRWLARTQGVTADGAPTTSTNVIYLAGNDVWSWRSVNRTIGGQPLPDSKELVLDRSKTSK